MSDCGVGQLSWIVTKTKNLSVVIRVLVYQQCQHATIMRTVRTDRMSCTAVRRRLVIFLFIALTFILT